MEFEKVDSQLDWFKLPKNEWTGTYWAFINIIVSHYRPDQMTEEAKKAFIETMLNFRYLLPCPKCRAHFEDHIKLNPIEHYWDKRDGLIEWIKPVLEKTKKQTTTQPLQTIVTKQPIIPSINKTGSVNQIQQNLQPNDQFSRNRIAFVQTIPEQHKKRGPFVKVPQVTEEIVSTVIEGSDGKKISIKRNRAKEMTFKEYIQWRVDTNPHVSACNCG